MMYEIQHGFPPKTGFPYKWENCIRISSRQGTQHQFTEQQTSKPCFWLPKGPAFRIDSTMKQEPESRKRCIQKRHTASILLVHMFKGGVKCACKGEREVASSAELFLQTAGGLKNEDLWLSCDAQKFVTLNHFNVAAFGCYLKRTHSAIKEPC